MTDAQESTLDGVEAAIDTMEPVSADVEIPPADETRARRGRTAVIKRWTRRCLARTMATWRPILLVVLVIAAIALAAGLYQFQYLTDRRVNHAAAEQAIKAASDGAVAVLSYSPDNLNRDFANAKSRLTGEFLAYYQTFTEKFVGPMAEQKQITTHASVVRAAVSELHPNSAVVLVFINQSTASKDKPDPVITVNSVLVTLTKVNGSWLISKFDPL